MLDKMNMSVGSFEKIKGDEVFHFFFDSFTKKIYWMKIYI